MRALIVEHGRSRAVLAASRALSRAGWTVGVGSPIRDGLAASSRSVERWHWVPPPQHGLDAFVAAVNAAVAAGGYEAVFGGEDTELLAISERRADIGAHVPHSPHEVVLRALDKLELLEAARQAGFATPRTVPATDDALAGWVGPVVVKPRTHPRLAGSTRTRRVETGLVSSPADAERPIAEMRELGVEPLLQEVVDGSLMAYVAVSDHRGRTVAELQQRTELTWPPEAGTSVRARTVSVDPELSRRAATLFAELGWFGLVELQFQLGDGEPRLIDFNGRFYGSMSLSLAAGVNLPAIWAALATNRPVPASPARTGVRYHWLEADLRRAFRQRRGNVVVDVLDCLRYARGASHSIWARDDPGPAIARTRLLGRRAACRATRARTSD